MQLSKTVYFRDYPESKGANSGLTIPFPADETEVYRFVEPLSSFTIRQLIGYDSFHDLERAAKAVSSPVATYARQLIGRKTTRNAYQQDTATQLQATFRGGKGSPLHDWYPYLEGYSPDFVTSIFRQYAPHAKTVLDPFCGSGTTALVAALEGRNGLYAEINPVCRFIIEAKTKALQLSAKQRSAVADKLASISDGLAREVRKHKPDLALKASFSNCFGSRPFFDVKTFDNVLRLRSWIDAVVNTDPLLAQFLTVAVLRTLVPASLLIRRGDLRFRTASEDMPVPLFDELKRSIEIIASDLIDAKNATGDVKLVCSDARLLAKHCKQKVEAIVTSPPYLNGTNYFRNTKIELWFLRELSGKGDLRKFRDGAITAGINDVTVSKSSAHFEFDAPKLLSRVLRELQDSAYDQRIPLMVQSYFQEMNRVVAQLRSVSAEDALTAIDLGDSCYGSVWVPTDQILSQLMDRCGFEQTDKVVLRERQSRDGRKLSQTLQIFKVAQKKRASSTTKSVKNNSNSWTLFRNELPHQQGEMAKRNWGHPWHSLCSYQGKLKPSIAHSLVEALMPKRNGRLLDPFSGVGTIPFEARLQGHVAFGFDISPTAEVISRAKLEKLEAEEVNATLSALGEWIKDNASIKLDMSALDAIRFNGPLPSYFHTDTLREIVAARAFFKRFPASNGAVSLVQASLLHILHGNRPYALSRRSHPITPFAPTGPTEYRSLMERLTQKVQRSLAELGSIPELPGKAFMQDATAIWPEEVTDLDAIITSPPFFDSTRFHTANWMRLWFSGWEAKDFGTRPADFVDERQKRSFDVYESIFAQSADRLKKSGYFAVHLGKSSKCDMASMLSGIGSKYLRLIDSFSESVSHCESHGIRDKGTVTHHQYLLFQKA